MKKEEMETYLILLNPAAPHLTEEMWELLGHDEQIANQVIWPSYDPDKLVENSIEIPVQINGKVKARIQIELDAKKDDVLSKAKSDQAIKEELEGKTIRKEIYVPNKIVNIVIGG